MKTTEEINEEWRKWCEEECPDRLNSECWSDCRWLDDEDDD